MEKVPVQKLLVRIPLLPNSPLQTHPLNRIEVIGHFHNRPNVTIELEIHRTGTGAEVRALYPMMSDTKRAARVIAEFAGTVPSLMLTANQMFGKGQYMVAEVLGDVEADTLPLDPTSMFAELGSVMQKLLDTQNVDITTAVQTLEMLLEATRYPKC